MSTAATIELAPGTPKRRDRRGARLTGGTGTWGDLVAITARLASGGRLGGGAELEALHESVRAFVGVPHVFTYGAARMGLYEALRALGIGAGDEVVIPGFTCAVVVNAVRFAGATPVYADIELGRLGPDPQAVASAITRRTRAIIAHHLFGIPCLIDELAALARRHGVVLIEDAAMALGGRFRGRALGSFGDAAVFSMERTKMISTGNGGILVTADAGLAAALDRSHRTLPVPDRAAVRRGLERFALDFLAGGPRCGRPARLAFRALRRLRRRAGLPPRLACETFDRRSLYDDEYAGRRTPGYPWRFPAGLAGLARRQLRRIESQVAQRTGLARAFQEILRRKGAGVPQVDQASMQPSWLRYPFWVEDVEGWAARLRGAGIESPPLGRWFQGPVHPASCMQDPAFGYVPGTCPNGEWLGRRILNLPTSPRLGRWMIDRVERL